MGQMTILEAVLSLAGFTGSSIAGGLTWDILKHSGAKIIRSFKSRFASGEKKRFSGEEAVSYTHLDVYKRQGRGPAETPARFE